MIELMILAIIWLILVFVEDIICESNYDIVKGFIFILIATGSIIALTYYYAG
jgi:hypothetical protein